MGPSDRSPSEENRDRGAPAKRPYVPPRLERLGTIAELTHGKGAGSQFDSGFPPGHNKSSL